MADSEAMEVKLLEWIKSLEIQNEHDVLEIMKCDGFYKLKHLKDFRSEEDLHNLPLKKAEARRFLCGLEELEKNCWQFCPMSDSKEDDERSVHITVPPTKITLGGVKMTEKLRKQFEKENVIITNPLNDKRRFFNDVFATLFNASYARLQSRFVHYFKAERKQRWEFKCNIQKLRQNLNDKLVKDRKERLMDENNIIKKWASTEQEPYNLDALNTCELLKGKIDTTIEKLRNTLKSMMCLPSEQVYKDKSAQKASRRIKENQHHGKKRKRERLQRFTLEVAKRLGATICGDLYSPLETGDAQLSADDVKETVELLSVYSKNERLLEALNQLRDDLLDSTAWEVVMQWFNDED
ncbi:Hypothetical predicted protein [Paramuricea clavata]|uniref:Uncharacterized protein n=1 Tax=Paramuricea clavata TaxID=317549 RepID=A0A7D9EEC2_PARCT|nr:Hypothetical predicted protein [Paramuricea clavata]